MIAAALRSKLCPAPKIRVSNFSGFDFAGHLRLATPGNRAATDRAYIIISIIGIWWCNPQSHPGRVHFLAFLFTVVR